MQLFEHQRRAIDSCLSSSYKLVIRLPGTGKTIIMCEIVKALNLIGCTRILLLGPANLLTQYKRVFGETGITDLNIYSGGKIDSGLCVSSYDMLRLYPKNALSQTWDCVLCDEFHRSKNKDTQTNKIIWKLRACAKRWYSFTGTPFQNSPYEFFELLSIVSNRTLSPKLESCLLYKYPKKKNLIRLFFEYLGARSKRLNQGPILGVDKPEIFKKIILPIVDYMPPQAYLYECKMPAFENIVKKIQLTKKELDIYNKLLRQHRKRKDIEFFKDDLNDQNISSRFNYLSDIRQMLLSHEGNPSSKMCAVLNDVISLIQENKTSKVLIFSNFIENGLHILHKELIRSKVLCNLYDGSVGITKRNRILSEFNSGKVPIILLSPVGFEGLDIPEATDIFILDPHFNPERELQLMSRAIRAFSKNEMVTIRHYISTSAILKNGTIDEVIVRIAERKNKVNSAIKDCLV